MPISEGEISVQGCSLHPEAVFLALIVVGIPTATEHRRKRARRRESVLRQPSSKPGIDLQSFRIRGVTIEITEFDHPESAIRGADRHRDECQAKEGHVPRHSLASIPSTLEGLAFSPTDSNG